MDFTSINMTSFLPLRSCFCHLLPVTHVVDAQVLGALSPAVPSYSATPNSQHLLVSVSTQTLQNISLYLVGLRLAWLGSIEPDCLCIVGPSQKKNNQHRGTVPTDGPKRDRKLLLRLGFYSLFSAGC